MTVNIPKQTLAARFTQHPHTCYRILASLRTSHLNPLPFHSLSFPSLPPASDSYITQSFGHTLLVFLLFLSSFSGFFSLSWSPLLPLFPLPQVHDLIYSPSHAHSGLFQMPLTNLSLISTIKLFSNIPRSGHILIFFQIDSLVIEIKLWLWLWLK